MQSHSDKQKETQKKAAAEHQTGSKTTQESLFQDNRPNANQGQSFQLMANSSQQVQEAIQLREAVYNSAYHQNTIQLKSTDKQESEDETSEVKQLATLSKLPPTITPVPPPTDNQSNNGIVQRVENDDSSHINDDRVTSIADLETSLDKKNQSKLKREYNLQEGNQIPLDHNEATLATFLMNEKEEEKERQRQAAIAPIDKWLLKEARKDKYTPLVKESGYLRLSSEQKERLFKAAGVKGADRDNPETFKKIKKGLFKKSINWKKFAKAFRQVSGNSNVVGLMGSLNQNAGQDTAGQDPYAMSGSDVGYYATLFGSAGGDAMLTAGMEAQTGKSRGMVGIDSSTVSGNATGLLETLNYTTLVGNSLAIINSGITIYQTMSEISDKERQEQVMSDLTNVLISLGQISQSAGTILAEAQAMQNGQSMANIMFESGIQGAAQSGGMVTIGAQMFAISSVVAGTLQLIKGGYDLARATQIKKNLIQLKENIQSTDFKIAIDTAKETMSLKQVNAVGTMAAGAAAVVGGSILLAVGLSNPIGWIALTFGGIIAGIFAVYTFLKQSKQTKEFVKKMYRKDKGLDENTEQEGEKEKIDQWLMSMGYPKGAYSAFHSEFMLTLANSIHASAFSPQEGQRKEEARALLGKDGLKLTINEEKKTPSVSKIAKRLKNPY